MMIRKLIDNVRITNPKEDEKQFKPKKKRRKAGRKKGKKDKRNVQQEKR